MCLDITMLIQLSTDQSTKVNNTYLLLGKSIHIAACICNINFLLNNDSDIHWVCIQHVVHYVELHAS